MLLVLSPCLHPPPSCPLLSAGSHTPLSLPPHHHNRHHRCHPTEQMGAPGQSKGPPPAVKKVLSLFGSGREEDKMVGYLSFLKIGPKLLKFLPGGAGGPGMGSCVGVDLGVDERVCGWVGGWVAPVHRVLRAGQATTEFLSACAWPPGCASAQLYLRVALGPPRRAALRCGCWRRQEGEGPAHLADRLLLLEPGGAGAQGGTLYVQGRDSICPREGRPALLAAGPDVNSTGPPVAAAASAWWAGPRTPTPPNYPPRPPQSA